MGILKTILLKLVVITAIVGCESKGDSNLSHATSSRKESIEHDSSRHNRYAWLDSYEAKDMLVNRIAPPKGYERSVAEKNSLTDWLRHLPLKTGNPDVKLYNGASKYNQSAQFALLNIDTGKEDLQQCADAVMRLKAEYHYSRKEYDKIHFNFTSGDKAEYTKWIEGYRPVLKGNTISWVKKAQKDASYIGFKAYLKQVFMYAGSSSLSKELRSIPFSQMQPGDVLIKGGFPGHAVIVLDMAANPQNGKNIYMLAQSYMPAQDIHILKNPAVSDAPWYALDIESPVETPEWTFQQTELKRFK
jgi:hypothetical protein